MILWLPKPKVAKKQYWSYFWYRRTFHTRHDVAKKIMCTAPFAFLQPHNQAFFKFQAEFKEKKLYASSE